MNRAEFERSLRLFNGHLQTTLTDDKIVEALHSHAQVTFEGHDQIILLHDGSDLRKPYSKKLENLGRVRSLEGTTIPGYSTFNTIALDEKGTHLRLLDHQFYSNRDPHFLSSSEQKAFFSGELENSCQPGDQARYHEIQQAFEEDLAHSTSSVVHHQLDRVSQTFKAQNPSVNLIHILDRAHDEDAFFEFIDEDLEDQFVIRLKLSRNSNQKKLDETGSKPKAIKLKDVEFKNKKQDILPKIMVKQKVYQTVTRSLEWDQCTFGTKSYSVLRIQLYKRNGDPLFKEPMLLITNISLVSYKEALRIYTLYLKRSKIEGVFKFLKETLGWEDFQLRHFEAIKNLVAFCFFIGAYFYEIETALVQHPSIQWICQLAGGQGKVTRHFLFKGLEKILIFQELTQQLDQHPDLKGGLIEGLELMGFKSPF